MKYPFQKKMPLGMHLRILMRLTHAWCAAHLSQIAMVLLAPALAVFFFLVVPLSQAPAFDATLFVSEVYAAQAAEQQKASEGIYHVVREIYEGSEKPAYVALQTGSDVVTPVRVDRIETYQHNETALAVVESNSAVRPFEVFLSRIHDEATLALHHYGPVVHPEIPPERQTYDEVHNLASLYSSYTSLDTPTVPVLSSDAVFVSIDETTNTARFTTQLDESLRLESVIDLDTKLVVEEYILITEAGSEYEMTRVVYLAREVVPASEFETVFDATAYEYEVVASKDVVL